MNIFSQLKKEQLTVFQNTTVDVQRARFLHFWLYFVSVIVQALCSIFRRDYALEDHVQDKTESKSALDVGEGKAFYVKIFPCYKKRERREISVYTSKNFLPQQNVENN